MAFINGRLSLGSNGWIDANCPFGSPNRQSGFKLTDGLASPGLDGWKDGLKKSILAIMRTAFLP